MASNRHLEQALCIEGFATAMCLRPINARIIHIPNGGARGKTEQTSKLIGKKIKDMGGVAGFPDYLILFDDGRFALLEGKLELKKLRDIVIHKRTDLNPAQKIFKAEMAERCGDGLRYGVFRSVDEFIDQLTAFGVRWQFRRLSMARGGA